MIVLKNSVAKRFDTHQEITPISLLPFNQCQVRRRTKLVTRVHLVETLHQEPRVKLTFFWRSIHFWENTYRYTF